jgi:hypothetical protein
MPLKVDNARNLCGAMNATNWKPAEKQQSTPRSNRNILAASGRLTLPLAHGRLLVHVHHELGANFGMQPVVDERLHGLDADASLTHDIVDKILQQKYHVIGNVTYKAQHEMH